MAESDPLSLIGKTLAGHFLVESLAGEGRFSIVYRGQHIGPKEPVALKCLKLGLELDNAGAETFLKRFREENKTNSRVSKSNALFVRSIGSGMTTSDAGQHVPYTVLEWLDGRSFAADLLARRSQGATGRSLSQVLDLLGPAISALGEAHEAGVAHGDLSPGSFFLTASGETKILDLGVAKLVNDLSREIAPAVTHPRIFSPRYGAPEHFDSRFGELGPATDVYGIALVVLEALRDRPAVEQQGAGAAKDQAGLALDPTKRPTPRALGLRVGDEVEKVMARAVALAAGERYANAKELLESLERAIKKDAAQPPAPPNSRIDEFSPADDEFDTLVRPPGEKTEKPNDVGASVEPRAPAVAPVAAAPPPPAAPRSAPGAPALAKKPVPKAPASAPGGSNAPPPVPSKPPSPMSTAPRAPVKLVPSRVSAPAAGGMTLPMAVGPGGAALHDSSPIPAAARAPVKDRPSKPSSGPFRAAAPAHPLPPPPPAQSMPPPPPPPPAPPPAQVAPPAAAPAPLVGIGDMSKQVREVIPPAPTNIAVGDLPSVIVEDSDEGMTDGLRRQEQALRQRETLRLDTRSSGGPPWMPQPPTTPTASMTAPAAPSSSPGPGALPIVALQDRSNGGGPAAMSYEARKTKSRSRLVVVAFVSFLVVFLAGATILGVHWFLAARDAPSAPAPTNPSP
jgi:serine/threonine-protein kinase